MYSQTTILIECAYGRRKFNDFAYLKKLTKYVGLGALPRRHGMIDTYVLK